MSTQEISQRILRWYARHGRSLPWRRSVDPYAIWVSEVMLQQTRADTVVRYYDRFLSRFPTISSLARAPLQEVLKAWENMGYYGRARSLHKAAQVISARMGGRFPTTYDELIRLPGVGRYTASAVLSFAFGKRVLAMDGNVKRVICRLFAVREFLVENQTLERIEHLGRDLLPARDSSSFNQALMDLGAMICVPRRPACKDCPLTRVCLAYRRGVQNELPIARKRAAVPHRHMTAALIRDGRGRLLVGRRPPHGLLGGMWKIPGGERRPGEKLASALERTVQEELGIKIEVGERRFVVQHAFTHFRMSLHVFECRRTSGRIRAPARGEWAWAGPRTLKSLPFGRADRRIVESIIGPLTGYR